MSGAAGAAEAAGLLSPTGARRAQQEPQGNALPLHCNFPMPETGRPCGKALGEGRASSCGHVFCAEHAKEWFTQSTQCPICKEKRGRVRLDKVSAAAADANAAQRLLLGCSPVDALRAARAALKFWIDQKELEFQQEKANERALDDQVKRLVSNARLRLTQAETLCKSLTAGREKLRKQLRDADDQLANDKQEVARLRARIQQAQQDYKESLGRAAGLRSTRRCPVKTAEVLTSPRLAGNPAATSMESLRSPRLLNPAAHQAAPRGMGAVDLDTGCLDDPYYPASRKRGRSMARVSGSASIGHRDEAAGKRGLPRWP